MHVWRVFKAIHKPSALTGAGARPYGGRWNSQGHAVVYTAQTLSLGILELLVHIKNHDLPRANHLYYQLELDDSLVES